MKAPRKIALEVPAAQVAQDLERYCARALELGASRCRVVRADEIPVDERVVLKCQVPRCFGYGAGAQCPPHTLKPHELRAVLQKCQWGVFFLQDVPAHVVVRDKATIKERVAAYQNVFKIVNEIESMAFYDGHYLAFGFAAGSCRHTYCGLEDDCQALKGLKCRFALRSRPSMEAVGIDVYRLAAASGWEIYPIGSDAQAADVPKASLAGIVIVR